MVRFRSRALQNSALAVALLVYAGVSQAAPTLLNVWNGPNQTIDDTNYLNTGSLAIQLSFSSVRLLADTEINVLEDIDVSTSVFGSTTGNLTLLAPDVNFLGDIIFSTGQFGVESVNFSLLNAHVHTPVIWNIENQEILLPGAGGGQLNVGSNSFLQLIGGTLGTNVLVDTDATLELIGYAFQLNTGSGFSAAEFGALNSNSGTLRGFLASGDAFEFDFSHDAALSNIVLTAVPVPAAAWLFASGLLGLVGVGRKRRRS